MKVVLDINLRDKVFFVSNGKIYEGMVRAIECIQSLTCNTSEEWVENPQAHTISVAYDVGTSAIGMKSHVNFRNMSAVHSTRESAGMALLNANGLNMGMMKKYIQDDIDTNARANSYVE